MADNAEKWGRAKAKERYGKTDATLGPNVEIQKPQMPEDKHGAGYDNDSPSNWLRGMGKDHAEGKPSFDHRKKD